MSEVFDCHTRGSGVAAGICYYLVGGIRDTAEHPAVRRTAHTAKDYLAQPR